ncbi:hypothetical protein [Massilia sp. DWR3-1-1]|uniref:hypothetical protein n=1 Tax=Massilia sp. DWR3-1-1 TaxID=2804559 RepID=UPI003CF37ADE
MFVIADLALPPVVQSSAPTSVLISEQWAAPPAPVPRTILVDPRISEAVAAVVAAAPERETAPNQQGTLQRVVISAAASEKFARDFSEAKVAPCLSPSTGGLGLLAIPVIAVQALRGKCLMP